MKDVDVVDESHDGVPLAERDDVELLAMARIDDPQAFATLFARYEHPALRLARHLGQRDEAEDVVAESFTQVLDLVRRGKGPDRAFRAYLFTTIRHEAGRRAKARRRVLPTDEQAQIDSVEQFGGGQLDEFEKSAIRDAYESLPERWRTVLWHLDVEGRKPHELGPLLGMSANSVSALVYRARSGLREAYLQQHVKTDKTAGRTCRVVRSKLSVFVRRAASGREQERIHRHLQACPACTAIYLDLQEVNREVGAIIAPTSLALSLSGGALLVTGGLVIGAGGLAALSAQVAAAWKGAMAAIAAPVAAAALTTTTVIGAASSGIIDPPRFPLGSQSAPAAQAAERSDPGHSAGSDAAHAERGASPEAPEDVPASDGAATPAAAKRGTIMIDREHSPVASTARDIPVSRLGSAHQRIAAATEIARPVVEPVVSAPAVQGLSDVGTSVARTVTGAVTGTVQDLATDIPR